MKFPQIEFLIFRFISHLRCGICVAGAQDDKMLNLTALKPSPLTYNEKYRIIKKLREDRRVRYLSTVSTSVVYQLPKLRRRVRLPYRAFLVSSMLSECRIYAIIRICIRGPVRHEHKSYASVYERSDMRVPAGDCGSCEATEQSSKKRTCAGHRDCGSAPARSNLCILKLRMSHLCDHSDMH